MQETIERLYRTQPPPGYEVRDTSYEDGDDEVGGYGVTVTEWTWVGEGYSDSAASRGTCLTDAWLFYSEDHDPPGVPVEEEGDAARAAAWAWYWRRVALANALDDEVRELVASGDDLIDGAKEPFWPRCLAWSDEQVSAVERWLAEGGDLPAVLQAG